MLSGMFSVSEAEAAAIRAAYEQGGELAAAVELRRYFAGIDRRVMSVALEAIHPAYKQAYKSAGAVERYTPTTGDTQN